MRYKLYKRVFYLQVLLLIPLVIMPFSDAVQWSVFDFVIMAVLLFFLGLGLDLVRFYAASKRLRWLLFTLVVLLFLLVWGELAVGIFN
jgi:hypothetical protein